MSTEANKQIVRRYFAAVHAGDIRTIDELFDDSVTFWVPPSLPDGVEFVGNQAVMRLFTESVALYDAGAGLEIELKELTADEDRVAVELVIRGRAAAGGAAYENWYHFLFRIRGGKIVAIREHLDSLYAFRTLFVPAGITEREHCTWLR